MASFKPLLIIVAFTVVFVASTPIFNTEFEVYKVPNQGVYDEVSTEDRVTYSYKQMMRTSVEQSAETPLDNVNEMARSMKVSVFPRPRKVNMMSQENDDADDDSNNRIYKNV